MKSEKRKTERDDMDKYEKGEASMNGWRKCKLGDVVVFQRGHDLPKTDMLEGLIPVAGSNGIIGYHDKSTTNGPGITIGRSGNIGTPKFYKSDFWAHNTVLYIKDYKGNDVSFIFHFLHIFDFSAFNAGSAVPTLNRNHIHEIPVLLPPYPEQRAIAGVLSCLYDKIDLLHRQNKTLEAMAETLFRQWFVEEVDEGWEEGIISDLFILQRGYDLPIQDRIEGAIPIVSSGGVSGTHFEHKVKGPGVVTGRSGLIGGVYFIADDFWPLNTSLYIKTYKAATPLYSYFFLRQLDLNAYNAGSSVPTLNRNHVHSEPAVIPPRKLIIQFDNIATPLFTKITWNQNRIRTLEKLRDTLLPKLMSGEVRVKI